MKGLIGNSWRQAAKTIELQKKIALFLITKPPNEAQLMHVHVLCTADRHTHTAAEIACKCALFRRH
jgi:hypothetical protein